jgi:predicted branched-subunit amino acid permease
MLTLLNRVSPSRLLVHGRKRIVRAFLAANLVCGFIFFALLGGLLAGCGSSVASAIKAGPIVFAGSSGGSA